MSIRQIQKGNIKCDKCGKELAKITTSKNVLEILDEDENFTYIICIDCEKSLKSSK